MGVPKKTTTKSDALLKDPLGQWIADLRARTKNSAKGDEFLTESQFVDMDAARRLFEGRTKLNKPKDFSGKSTPIQGMDKAMSLSEEQRAAAKAERYIPPSRVGKRALAGYFSDEVLAELKALAAIRQCTGQSLLDEALADLFKKHEEVLKVVRQALHTRKP